MEGRPRELVRCAASRRIDAAEKSDQKSSLNLSLIRIFDLLNSTPSSCKGLWLSSQEWLLVIQLYFL